MNANGLIERHRAGERDFHNANLRGANLGRAYLSGAYLRGANLYRANLRGAYLSGANLSWAYLYRAYLSGANWDEYTIFYPMDSVPNEHQQGDNRQQSTTGLATREMSVT